MTQILWIGVCVIAVGLPGPVFSSPAPGSRFRPHLDRELLPQRCRPAGRQHRAAAILIRLLFARHQMSSDEKGQKPG